MRIGSSVCCIVVLCCASGTKAQAVEKLWSGYQGGCATEAPQRGSAFDGANWSDWVIPCQGITDIWQCHDVARFGSDGIEWPPTYVHFGDFCLNVPGCSDSTEVFGGSMSMLKLIVESGSWTFDLGSYAYDGCSSESFQDGTLFLRSAQPPLTVGTTISATGLPGSADLTIVNGMVQTVYSHNSGIIVRLYIGNGPGCAGTLKVGSGGIFDARIDHISLASNGAQGSLEISEGGTAFGHSLNVGYNGMVLVSDVGSMLEIGSTLTSGGTLSVVNGAYASVRDAGSGFIMQLSGVMTISGPGSLLQVRKALGVASTLDMAVTVSDAGKLACGGDEQVSNPCLSIGVNNPATGAFPTGIVTVSGSGSTVSSVNQIWVGRGSHGRLIVDSGGVVTTPSVSVAVGSTSTGYVGVSGEASLLSAETIYVGGTNSAQGGQASLELNAGAAVSAPTLISIWNSGLLTGEGTVQTSTLRSRGEVRPRDSASVLTVSGNYEQLQEGILKVTVSAGTGNLSGARLEVGGQALLAGTLAVEVSDGTLLKSGDIVEALTYASHSGEFESVVAEGVPAEFVVLAVYGANRAALEFVLRGDGNRDGIIDSLDTSHFLACLGGPGQMAVAGCAVFDMDLNQSIDLKDYAQVMLLVQ